MGLTGAVENPLAPREVLRRAACRRRRLRCRLEREVLTDSTEEATVAIRSGKRGELSESLQTDGVRDDLGERQPRTCDF